VCESDRKETSAQENKTPEPLITNQEMRKLFHQEFPIPDEMRQTHVQICGDERIIRAHALQNGMVVLLEDPLERPYSSGEKLEEMDLAARITALRTARWCEVIDREIVEGLVCFTGVYLDGSQRGRTSRLSTAWLVKIDSIPIPES
jgi:hypothetical protein